MILTPQLAETLLEALPIGEIPTDDPREMERRAERLRAIATPDLEVAMVAEAGGLIGEFHGIDGYREAWDDWLVPFDACTIELEEVIETDDGLLVLTTQSVSPSGTSASIEGQAAAVLVFKDERLARLEFHLDRAAAFAAAGVDPS